MLSRGELGRFGSGMLTDVFIDRRGTSWEPAKKSRDMQPVYGDIIWGHNMAI